jgi:hypothetical protein
MAIVDARLKFEVDDYATYNKALIPQDGELWFFNNILTGIVTDALSVKGDGVTAVSNLPFQEIILIETSTDINIEILRIAQNKVSIENTHASNIIKVNIGTTGTPKYIELLSGASRTFIFNGTSWVSGTATKKGFISVGLTNLTNNSEPLIADGSIIDCDGVYYEATSNEDIDPDNSLALIATKNWIWLYIITSGLKPAVTTTAPVWNDEKRGWYDSGGTNRYYGGMYKDTSGNFTNKIVLGSQTDKVKIVLGDADFTIPDGYYNLEIIMPEDGITANRTVTLPTLADNQGVNFRFQNFNTTYALYIDGEGAETIEGFATINLSTEWIKLTAIITEWKRTGQQSERPIFHVVDEKADTTEGGSNAGSFALTQRVLNQSIVSEIIGASLTSNNITLPPGRYRIIAKSAFVKVGRVKAYLYDGSSVFYGYSLNTHSETTTVDGVILQIDIKLNLLSGATFGLYYKAGTASTTIGLGVAVPVAADSITEWYSGVWIEKLL